MNFYAWFKIFKKETVDISASIFILVNINILFRAFKINDRVVIMKFFTFEMLEE